MIHHISVSSLCCIITCALFLAGCAKQNINTKQKNTISQEVSQDHTVTKTHDQDYSGIEEYIDRLYGSNGANLTLDQLLLQKIFLQTFLQSRSHTDLDSA